MVGIFKSLWPSQLSPHVIPDRCHFRINVLPGLDPGIRPDSVVSSDGNRFLTTAIFTRRPISLQPGHPNLDFGP